MAASSLLFTLTGNQSMSGGGDGRSKVGGDGVLTWDFGADTES